MVPWTRDTEEAQNTMQLQALLGISFPLAIAIRSWYCAHFTISGTLNKRVIAQKDKWKGSKNIDPNVWIFRSSTTSPWIVPKQGVTWTNAWPRNHRFICNISVLHPFFDHDEWRGMPLYDVYFPFFLDGRNWPSQWQRKLISLPLHYSRMRGQNPNPRSLFKKGKRCLSFIQNWDNFNHCNDFIVRRLTESYYL